MIRGFSVFFILFVLTPLGPLGYGEPPMMSFKRILSGDIGLVEITLASKPLYIKARFGDKEPVFFKDGAGNTFNALIGAGLSANKGIHPLTIEVYYEEGTAENHFYPVIVEHVDFGMETLSLPKEMVEYDKETLERIEREKELVRAVTSKASKDRLWKGAFIMPVEGSITSGFGTQRVLNGKVSYRHAGVDLKAPLGEKILSANRGRVVLSREFYLGGKTVILDHGLGLFSLYSHLSKVNVKQGDVLDKGGVIGLSGSTGRATGAHLHWGSFLNAERLNPLSLISAI